MYDLDIKNNNRAQYIYIISYIKNLYNTVVRMKDKNINVTYESFFTEQNRDIKKGVVEVVLSQK